VIIALLIVLVAPAGALPGKPRSGDSGDPSASLSRHVAKHSGLVPVPPDGLTRALERGGLTEAQYALERASSLFGSTRSRFGTVRPSDPRIATLMLRDLAVRVQALDGAQRARALAILARPDDGAADPSGDGYTVPSVTACSTNVCLHWVVSSIDAPPLTDADGSGYPDWVETNADVLEDVWQTEVTNYGYRPPKSDLTSSNHGPDSRIDVYLADIGDDGLFGYCTTDDPDILDGVYPPYDGSAYCVLDNDFSAAQFGSNASGLIGLQATAPHEFFHAVQFAYDALEDAWFMESTATWMEDEVFDNVNDNRTYLSTSSMRQGYVPVDFGDLRKSFVYGNWIYIRFLTEYFGTQSRADPSFVRDAWEWADGSAGGPDFYSMQALEKAARERNWYLEWAFADFGAVNLAPKRFYEEGSAYPTPKIDKTFGLTAARSDSGWWSIPTDHLTNSYLVFTPKAGISRSAKLGLLVDSTARSTMPQATAVVFFKTGAVKNIIIKLDARGDGSRQVPFGKGTVQRVVLVLTNASTRYKCWLATPYSCSGKPFDDNRKYFFRAVVT